LHIIGALSDQCGYLTPGGTGTVVWTLFGRG
jgi:hypothetical protein